MRSNKLKLPESKTQNLKRRSGFFWWQLFDAIKNNDPDKLTELLVLGADSDVEITRDSLTIRPLLEARHVNLTLAEILIDFGADVDFE